MTIKVGYEPFVPPPVPPGMHFDRDLWLAGRGPMAPRQITGLFLNGELASGPLIWLFSRDLNSVGDFFAGTVVLHDPNQLLHR
jgi:uncharacterized RDD family membrane protein YckC